MIPNTFKIVRNNFGAFWKILLYKVVCILLVVMAAYSIMLPLVKQLATTDFFEQLYNGLYLTLVGFDIEESGVCLIEAWDNLVVIFNQNLSGNTWLCVICIVFILLVGKTLFNLADLPLSSMLCKRMGQNEKVGFISSFASNFKNSILVQMVRLVVVLPLDIIIIMATYYISKGCVMLGCGAAISFILAATVFICLYSFRFGLFAALYPAIVEDNCKIFAAISASFKAFFALGLKGYVSLVLFTLGIVVFSGVLIWMTLGIALIIVVPVVVLLGITYCNVYYFTACSKKYYISNIVFVKSTY